MIDNRFIQLFIKRRGLDETTYENLKNCKISYEETKLKDLDEICDYLYLNKDKNITIIPDYDADGIMSGTILYAGLSEMGFENVKLFNPSTTTGYGFSLESVKIVLEQYPETELFLTCDNGIGASEAIDYAKKLGIETLVTDHHPETERTSALFIVNPSRLDETYPFKGLSGGYVAFKVMTNYAKKYLPKKTSVIERLQVFAGISVITDVMPVLEENRQLIKDTEILLGKIQKSISHIETIAFCDSEVYRSSFKGLKLLLEKLTDNYTSAYDTEFVGFKLGPVLNSARRVKHESSFGFDVFFHDDKQKSTNYLIQLNEIRKETASALIQSLEPQIAEENLIYTVESGMKGYTGLIASRICQNLKKPCIVLSKAEDGLYIGSGRSPHYLNMESFLENISDFQEIDYNIAGHSHAFGFKIEEKDIEKFHERLRFHINDVYEKQIAEEIDIFDLKLCMKENTSTPTSEQIDSNYDYNIDNMNILELKEFINEIETIKPFGNGFEKPVINLTIQPDLFSFRYTGIKKQHTILRSSNLDIPFELLLWNENIDSSMPMLSLNGTLKISHFNGEEKISFTRIK